MKKSMSRRRSYLRIAIAALLAVGLIAGLIRLFSDIEKNVEQVPDNAGKAQSLADENGNIVTGYEAEPAQADIYYNGREYVYNSSLSTLLILGIDDDELVETASYRNTSQADFFLLAVFDSEKKECTLIQLNRDTMCDVPVLDTFGTYFGLRNEQLALAHTYGNGLEKSCENTVHAVSRLMYGVDIENYFSLTMDAIPILNELVGGVEVTVTDDFTGVDASLVKGETVRLTAENVENYVRARMHMKDDPTNINRMARQRVYMSGLFEALIAAYKNNTSFVLDAYSKLADSLVSDCTVNEMSEYAELFSDYTLSEIVTPEGEALAGEKYMEFHVDEAALQQLVIDTFYLPMDGK